MRAPDFWSRPHPTWASTLLSPFGLLYALAGRYRRATTTPVRAPCPVLCIGNLTAGGTGKTPIALALAKLFMARGARPVFLTRGYGGRERGPLWVDPRLHRAEEVGDEALLLARCAPTILSVDRSEAARLVSAEQILIMDDGFQNPTLHKDLSLLVVDGTAGIGNGAVIPAGPLREPLREGLARAQGLILMGEGHLPPALVDLWSTRALLRARLVPEPKAAASLSGARVFAFAGIGRPQKFFCTLTECGATLTGAEAFPDHHPYSVSEIEALRSQAAKTSARLLTTEKDWVRLQPAQREGIDVLAVTAALEPQDTLDHLLANILKRRLRDENPIERHRPDHCRHSRDFPGPADRARPWRCWSGPRW